MNSTEVTILLVEDDDVDATTVVRVRGAGARVSNGSAGGGRGTCADAAVPVFRAGLASVFACSFGGIGTGDHRSCGHGTGTPLCRPDIT